MPIYRKLAALTGLDEGEITRWRGRIPLDAYLRDVKKGNGRIVSRL